MSIVTSSAFMPCSKQAVDTLFLPTIICYLKCTRKNEDWIAFVGSVHALGTVVRLGFCFFEASPSCTYAPYGPTLMTTWDVTIISSLATALGLSEMHPVT